MIRIILSLVVSNHWVLRQLDFNNAFPNRALIEEVYMSQPPRFVYPQYLDYVCRLRKAIYSLKKAPQAWNDTLKHTLLNWGFVNSKANTSLFIFRLHNSILLFLV